MRRIVIGLAATLIAALGYFHYQLRGTPLEQAKSGICIVWSGSGSGTGVLLESGYILTAGHVIDRNQNGILDDEEKKINITFWKDDLTYKSSRDIKAEVIGMAFNPWSQLDIAVIKPCNTVPISGVKLISNRDYHKLRFGEKVFTIGGALGLPPHYGEGRLTLPSSSLARSSINVLHGNSGGGVHLMENGDLIGLMIRVPYAHGQVTVPMFSPEGRQYGIVQTQTNYPAPNMSEFIPVTRIRYWLASQHLEYVLDDPTPCPSWPWIKDHISKMPSRLMKLTVKDWALIFTSFLTLITLMVFYRYVRRRAAATQRNLGNVRGPLR